MNQPNPQRPDLEEIADMIEMASQLDKLWSGKPLFKISGPPVDVGYFIIADATVNGLLTYTRSLEAENAELRAALAGCKERLPGFKEGLRTSDASTLPESRAQESQ
jgi:hypothetical protein